MRVVKLHKHIRPSGDQLVRYKVTGHISEVFWNSSPHTHGCPIRKLSKDTYLNVSTGEVFTSNHITTRADNLATVRKSMNRLRDLLNANVTDPTHCRWITLTYAANMTDSKQLSRDFANFIKKMHRRYGDFEYIVIAEPQARGAWHTHAVLIFPDKAPYIPNPDLAAVWGHGYVSVKSIHNITNIGRYLTAHLGDLEYDEAIDLLGGDLQNYKIKEVELIQNDGEKITKRIVKGARLHLYPPQFHFYRRSRRIREPIIERIPACEAEAKTAGAKLIDESTVQISDDATGFKSIFNRRHYKTN